MIEVGNVRFSVWRFSCCQSLSCGTVSISVLVMPPCHPDNFQQTNCIWTSYCPWLFFFLCPCGSELTLSLGSAFCALPFCCERCPLAHPQVCFLLPYEGTLSDLFYFGQQLTLGKTWSSANYFLTCFDNWKGTHSVVQEEVCPRKWFLVQYEEDFSSTQGYEKMG